MADLVATVSAPEMTAPGVPRRRRFGIRARLMLAFGVVAGLTVLASSLSFIAFDNVGRMMASVTGESLSAMSVSLRLERIGHSDILIR